MYKHILLALHNDAEDPTLIQKAYSLAVQHQSRLSALHVVDFIPSDVGDPLNPSIDSALPQQHVQRARQQLEKRINALPTEANILIDSHVTMGAARREIISYAEQCQCDLIVLGHHAHHGIGHILGHTDESVLHHAPCDVLAINLSLNN